MAARPTDRGPASPGANAASTDKVVALTFDDGPHPVYTNRSSTSWRAGRRRRRSSPWATGDYQRPGKDVIVDRVLSRLHPGAVVLMHDGPGRREQTVAALPEIIDGIRARGYRIVPVCGSPTRVAERLVVAAAGPTGMGATSEPVSAHRLAGMAATATGGGYWVAAADGGVFAFGDAGFHGSLSATPLVPPVVGIAATPSGAGYRMVAGDGGVFAFGDSRFHGSLGATPLARPIVGIAATPSGAGYWLVAGDGGVFAFGDARFHGGMGAIRLTSPIVGIAATPSGAGYWLVAAGGGVFTFGDAAFYGSLGGTRLSSPIVGVAAMPSGAGYWLAAADGAVFAFGDAPFHGDFTGDLAVRRRAIAAAPQGGYWVLGAGMP